MFSGSAKDVIVCENIAGESGFAIASYGDAVGQSGEMSGPARPSHEPGLAATGVKVTGPSRPESVSDQLEASKGLPSRLTMLMS